MGKINIGIDLGTTYYDEIFLVGGSTYMPQVKTRLSAEYGKPVSINEPDKAVAIGAAIVANNCADL